MSSVLVLRLSLKWIGRGVKKFNIFEYFTLSVNGIKTMLSCLEEPEGGGLKNIDPKTYFEMKTELCWGCAPMRGYHITL